MKNIKNIFKTLIALGFASTMAVGSSQQIFALPQEAIDSYNNISVVNPKTNKFSNDLALLNEFVNNETYRIKIVTDFTGGELQEVIDASDHEPRSSVLKDLNHIKMVFKNVNDNSILLEKEATVENQEAKGDSKAVKYFFVDLSKSEIGFNTTYAVELINLENKEEVGKLNVTIPEKPEKPTEIMDPAKMEKLLKKLDEQLGKK